MADGDLPGGKLYYSIGEVARALSVKPSLLRFWEGEFELIRPKKNKKGNRYYTPEDVKNLKLIYQLVKERGFTLAGARQKLKKRKALSKLELIDKLKGVKSALENLKNQIPT